MYQSPTGNQAVYGYPVQDLNYQYDQDYNVGYYTMQQRYQQQIVSPESLQLGSPPLLVQQPFTALPELATQFLDPLRDHWYHQSFIPLSKHHRPLIPEAHLFHRARYLPPP